MGLHDIIKSTEKIISNPGDKMSGRVTDSGRQVIKVQKGDEKWSATRYSNGTIVETKVRKNKK